MAVRLRRWITAAGEERRAWIVDYTDGRGKRRLKTFAAGEGQERRARDFEAKTRVDIRKGTHVADSTSITVSQAASRWLERLAALGRERSTLEAYKSHLTNHIGPALGRLKLSQLDALLVSDFEDALLRKATAASGRSGKLTPKTVSKVITTLGSLIADAQARGLVGHNVVRERPRRALSHRKHRLEVGRDIPTVEDIRRLLTAARPGLCRALLITAVFTGLRASELRGLRWRDVDLEQRILHVRQRVDRWSQFGPPKSAAGARSVPLPPIALNTLREWKLQSSSELCFANRNGHPIRYADLIRTYWHPTLKAASLESQYTGLHCLRHFFASWCLNTVEAGGLGLSPKATQVRLGHTSIVMTMDIYGHLFPASDDAEALAAAERRLLG